MNEIGKRAMVWLSGGEDKEWEADRWKGGVYEIEDFSLRELCILEFAELYIPEAAVNMMYVQQPTPSGEAAKERGAA